MVSIVLDKQLICRGVTRGAKMAVKELPFSEASALLGFTLYMSDADMHIYCMRSRINGADIAWLSFLKPEKMTTNPGTLLPGKQCSIVAAALSVVAHLSKSPAPTKGSVYACGCRCGEQKSRQDNVELSGDMRGQHTSPRYRSSRLVSSYVQSFVCV